MRKSKRWYHLSLADIFWIVGFFSIQFAILASGFELFIGLGLPTYFYVCGAILANYRLHATRNQGALFAWLCGTFGLGVTLAISAFFRSSLTQPSDEFELSLVDVAGLLFTFGLLVGGFVSTLLTAFYYILHWSMDSMRVCDATIVAKEPRPPSIPSGEYFAEDLLRFRYTIYAYPACFADRQGLPTDEDDTAKRLFLELWRRGLPVRILTEPATDTYYFACPFEERDRVNAAMQELIREGFMEPDYLRKRCEILFAMASKSQA